MQPRMDTPARIRYFRGIKRKPREKPLTQQALGDRAEELRLEKARWERFEARMRKKKPIG
jgi:hypothetical protein